MHELSLVAELVDECLGRAGSREIEVIRVRHASTISEDTVRQAFDMLTTGSRLAGVRLETEEFGLSLHCAACDRIAVLDHDHAIGHIRVCPACGTVSNDPQTCELELVAIVERAATINPAFHPGARP
jgi:Zn finger protein HypA/HybF involved in hydrogenase expression